MKINCAHTKVVPFRELKPNPGNANKHPPKQIQLLAKIMKHQGWRNPIVVSTRSGLMTKGHGRLEAAKMNGWFEAPVDFQHYESEDDEIADMIADNKIAELAESDDMKIQEHAIMLGPDFDFDLFGIDEFKIKGVDTLPPDGSENFYTSKVTTPIYEPKGEKPELSELCDLTKTEELLSEIESTNLPSDIRAFLEYAAQRHTVFDYEKIAEFYSHAPVEVQTLFENSALVIIDFHKAIENGFVVLTNELAEAYPRDEKSE